MAEEMKTFEILAYEQVPVLRTYKAKDENGAIEKMSNWVSDKEDCGRQFSRTFRVCEK